MGILEDLKWRGLLADCTDFEGLAERLGKGPIALYCGFDPTGDSLHIGHLMGQLTLRRFQLAGHRPIALAGGATGMIGDPSGKSAERNLLSREQLAHNVASIKGQLERLLDFTPAANSARLVDNADWIAPITMLDFLRDVGKFFPVGAMLSKESVRSRMENESGISYTEFSYQLLQAYDFCRLRNDLDCELQIGGTDQWGNITAGIDLIRKKLGKRAWGLTFPLITKSDGTKFGKTEDGAVWLDPKRASPYKLYQFFVNAEDTMVVDYLKKFTFLSKPEIEELAAQHEENPGAREAHKALGREVTTIVHGQEAMRDAVAASAALFGGKLTDITEAVFEEVVADVPSITVRSEEIAGNGLSIVDLLPRAELSQSKGQARKDIEGGGIYLNNERTNDIHRRISTSDLLFGKYVLLRKGKRTHVALRLAD